MPKNAIFYTASESGARHVFEKPLRQLNLLFAVDTSGSTMGAVMHDQLRTMRNLHTKKSQVAWWDSTCDDPVPYSKFIKNPRWGGTVPSTILKNSGVVSALASSQCFVLMTDGCISDSEVKNLSEQAELLSHMAVIVIVTTEGSQANSSHFFSVSAAFQAACSDYLLLHSRAKEYSDDFYVVYAKGAFAELDTRKPEFKDFEKLAPERLKNIKIPVTAARNDGTVAVGGAFVNPCALLEADLPFDRLRCLVDNVMEMDLALLYKTRGELASLRRWANRHLQTCKAEAVHVQDSAAGGIVTGELQREKEALFREFVGLDAEARKGPRGQALQRRIRELNAAIRDTLKGAASRAKSRTREPVAYLNDLLAAISTMEKATYGMDLIGKLSNRAARAKVVEPWDALVDLEAYADPHGDHPRVDMCTICLEDKAGRACIALGYGNAIENSGNFATDAPLAHAHRGWAAGASPLLPPAMCTGCASEYVSPEEGASTCPITRQPIVGVLPVARLVAEDDMDELGDGLPLRLFKNALARAFTRGLEMHSLPQLFVGHVTMTLLRASYASSEEPSECYHSALVFMLQQVLAKCTSYDRLASAGSPSDIVPLGTAMENALTAERMQQHYPVDGVLVAIAALQFAQGRVGLDLARRVLHLPLVRHIAMLHAERLKSGASKPEEPSPRGLLLGLVFGKMHLSEPVSGTACLVGDLELLLGEDVASLLRDVAWAAFGFRSDESILESLLYAPALSYFAFGMASVEHYDKAAKLIERERAKGPVSELAIDLPWDLTAELALDSMNAPFKRQVPSARLAVAECRSPLGASVVFDYHTQEPFLPRDFCGSLEQAVPLIDRRRAEVFREHYGSRNQRGYPDERSGHTNLMHAVVSTFRRECTSEENAQAALKHVVKTRRGNIHNPLLVSNIEACVEDYRENYAARASFLQIRECIRSGYQFSLAEKLCIELEVPHNDISKQMSLKMIDGELHLGNGRVYGFYGFRN